jgi:hypothetical protein
MTCPGVALMNADNPVLIEVPDAWDRIPAGDFAPLRLVIHRPPHQDGAVTIPFVNHPDAGRVSLNTDLFQREVTLHPGESYTLTVGARFHFPGPANLSEFYVQVNPAAGQPTLVRLPDRPVRVVPSLSRQVETKVDRICGYDQGVKLELLLRHAGDTPWGDLEIVVGPAGRVQAGMTRHRRPVLEPGQQERFEVVVDGEAIELSLAGTAGGERVEDRRLLPIPPSDAGPTGFPPFAFLEPRALTVDRITVLPASGGQEVQPGRGCFPVSAGQRYMVTVYPSHPGAEDVDLFGAAGQAEVESMKSEGGAWSFVLTVVDNSLLTQLVRLYYDVQIPGRVLRGELYLSVRPSSAKTWAIAATAGAAVTIKGLTALAPALLDPEQLRGDLLSGLSVLFQKRWTDWLQLLSIPLFRAGLWILDRLIRPFRAG